MGVDTVFITILRNPVTQFESTFQYMEFAHLLGIPTARNPVETFFEDPNKILSKISRSLLPEGVLSYLNLLKNGQFFDLGLDSAQFYEEGIINHEIKELARSFNLVLMMEYFD